MKRKHHDVIVAWAGGAAIQYRNPEIAGRWVDTDLPAWVEGYEYRVKPAEAERKYPETRLSGDELYAIARHGDLKTVYALRNVANAALRHAIDHGQVVTREEFDRAIGDRRKRDMAVAEAVRDNAYVQVMNCDNSLEGVVVRTLDLPAIIRGIK